MPSNRKLSYERSTKALDLMPKSNEEKRLIEDNDVTLSSVVTDRLKGYEKTDGVMSYSIVCVISGGEKRERVFLQTMIRQQDIYSLRVAFVSKERQGLQPYQMQEKWEEIQRTKIVPIKGGTFLLDDMDKVFLVSDVDEFYEQLVKIHEGHRKDDSGQWIISNPCFEVWLYYCFLNKPEEDLASIESLSPEQRSQEMKHLGPKVIEGGLDPVKAFEHMQEGIVHSISHYAEDNNSIPILFATQMHQMAQFLIDTMNRNRAEYDEFVRRKQQQRQEWRRMMMKKKTTSST